MEDEANLGYVKTSARKVESASPARNKSKKSKGGKQPQQSVVVVSTPSGFRHEFHLEHDEDSRDSWDVEKWRVEIERRVQIAAAQHAALNAAMNEAASSSSNSIRARKPRPQSMVKRKPVPSIHGLVAGAGDPRSASVASLLPLVTPLPPTPLIPQELLPSGTALAHKSETPATGSKLREDGLESRPQYPSSSSSSSSIRSTSPSTRSSSPAYSVLPHLENENDTASIASSLSPPTPVSGSPRSSSSNFISVNTHAAENSRVLTTVAEGASPLLENREASLSQTGADGLPLPEMDPRSKAVSTDADAQAVLSTLSEPGIAASISLAILPGPPGEDSGGFEIPIYG